MGLDLLVHVLGVGLLLYTTDDFWMLSEGVLLVLGVVLIGLFLWRFAIEPLLVDFLTLNLINYLISAYFNFFQYILLIRLRLNLYSLIDHITQLSIPLI